ncbi:hypothetical protein Plec18170_005724 [Paecilomyces lecythidis]
MKSSVLSRPPDIHAYLSDLHALSSDEREAALKYPQPLFYIEEASHGPRNSDDLLALKSRATDRNPESWVSTFEALTAYLWQKVYQTRILYLVPREDFIESTASKISTGLWASLNVRGKERLDLSPRYFPNAVHATCMNRSHEMLAHGDLRDVAAAVHKMIRSEDKERILQTTRWITAQPDKSLIRVNFTFGNGNFTVSQWSGFDMYSGVYFDVDESGKPIHPSLVAPPFTEISRVDGLAMILSSEETVEVAASTKACSSCDLPCAIDVNLTLSEPLWQILDTSSGFRSCYR